MKFAVAVLVCSMLPCSAAPVSVRMESITLPTYAEGPPDPVPPFDSIYPYARRIGITEERNDQTWRVIVLENEYLRCRILPDLAGRLYGCTDKRNGREMFFANSSIRKAPIGLRGAWMAAGIEPNFPIGHTVDAVSPVDFAFRQNSDGSAAVITGSVDRVTAMTWQTEFLLHPGDAALEENVTLVNPTSVPHDYYWWNDAQFNFRDQGTRFIIPAHLVETHGGTAMDTWPIDHNGRDISLPAYYPQQTAWFAYGSKEPFEAVHEPSSHTATVHVSDPTVLTGAKIFGWGHKDEEYVRHALTDDGTTYIEMQAGLFRNQETFQKLAPGHTRTFTEYWLPVRDLPGISRAVPEAVIALKPGFDTLQVGVEVMRPLPRAHILVTQGGKPLLDETGDLDPSRTWSKTARGFALGLDCRFQLRDSTGRLIVSHSLAPDGRDVYDALTPRSVWLGDRPARQQSLAAPVPRGPQAPATDPGALLASQGELQKAAAALDAEWRREPANPYPAALEVAVLRHAQNLDAAKNRLHDALTRAPENSMLRLESVLLGGSDDALWLHLGANPDRVLDVVAEYLSLGFTSDALALLSREYPSSPPDQTELGTGLPQQNALVVYYRAWCRSRLGQPFAADLEAAQSLPLKYVFPYRASDQTVLEWAVKNQENDGGAHLLLGYVYRFQQDRWRAMEQWQRARTLRPDLPALAAVIENDQRAQEAAARSARAQRVIAQNPISGPLTIASSARPSAPPTPPIAIPAPALSGSGAGPDAIAADALITSLHELDTAIGQFNAQNFPSEKQDDFVRRVWLELQLQHVLALARAGDCAATLSALDTLGDEVPSVPFTIRGFGFVLREPRVEFYQAEVENRCGREKEAHKHLERLAHSKPENGDVFPILAALSLSDPAAKGSAEAALKEPATTGAQLYSRGLLLAALRRNAEARNAFRQGAQAKGDDFAHYLNVRALVDLQ